MVRYISPVKIIRQDHVDISGNNNAACAAGGLLLGWWMSDSVAADRRQIILKYLIKARNCSFHIGERWSVLFRKY